MGLLAAAIACSVGVLLGLMVLLERRFRRLEDRLGRQQRLLEGLSSMGMGIGATMPRPPTVRVERGGAATSLPTPREPTPRALSRLADPSPRGSHRLEPSPRGIARLGEVTPQGSRLPSAVVATPGQTWAPSHRITFAPEHGRPESWLVMMNVATSGGRLAITKSEWTAGVSPAWQCASDGVWMHHGAPTPGGVKGKISIEEFQPSY